MSLTIWYWYRGSSHSLIRGVLIQSCSAGAKNSPIMYFVIHSGVISKILKIVVPFWSLFAYVDYYLNNQFYRVKNFALLEQLCIGTILIKLPGAIHPICFLDHHYSYQGWCLLFYRRLLVLCHFFSGFLCHRKNYGILQGLYGKVDLYLHLPYKADIPIGTCH